MDIKVKALLIIAVAAGCYTSCKKNDDQPPATYTTSLLVVNATDNTNLNYYVNGGRINNTSVLFPGGTLGYLPVTAGAQDFEFKVPGGTTPLFSIPLTLSKDSVYSLYAGTTADETFYTNDVLLADTDLNLTKLRFVNASPDAGTMEVRFESKTGNVTTDTVRFKDVAFKKTSNYITFKAGTHNVVIYPSASPAGAVRDTITFTGGRVYTFYGFGSVKSNLGLGRGLITNR